MPAYTWHGLRSAHFYCSSCSRQSFCWASLIPGKRHENKNSICFFCYLVADMYFKGSINLPTYRNKHWTIKRWNNPSVDPSSHSIILKIVGFFFWPFSTALDCSWLFLTALDCSCLFSTVSTVLDCSQLFLTVLDCSLYQYLLLSDSKDDMTLILKSS